MRTWLRSWRRRRREAKKRDLMLATIMAELVHQRTTWYCHACGGVFSSREMHVDYAGRPVCQDYEDEPAW